MSQMNRVSMSHLRCVQPFAVMVDGTRAVDNLIASVTVYVTHSGEGEGLLFYGNVILPFVDRFPRGELYDLLTTKPQEQTA